MFTKSFGPRVTLVLLLGVITTAQEPLTAERNGTAVGTKIIVAPKMSANSTPLELARAALAAQGGDKFKNLKSIILTGGVDLYGPNMAQSVPGKFTMVLAGDRARLEIDARPLFNFKLIHDGQRSYSSIAGVDIPSPSKFGPAILPRLDQSGYTISALPDKKKLRGFRVVDSDGNTTDFYVDPVNGRVVMYLTPYNGYLFGTEISKFKEVEGILVPFGFSQRIDAPQGTFFASYKVNHVQIDAALMDDVFKFQ